ncbi:MAG: DNA polymerase III subunit delta [Methyloceanibacter sp.]|uniref:DNA polymerase III subunit delta n=1 Tax=Methyloceanibacter sp. TaxID=1965321 RepID=UPI003D9B5BEA
MVAYKSASVPRFLKSPDPACRFALVYGPDAGLVTERAEMLARVFGARGKGDAEIVRLDERDLAEDASRIEVEFRTVPMFAERKVVRVGAGARLDVPMLRELLATASHGGLVIEAGNLRPDSALRKLFEGHREAAALPCYSEAQNTTSLIDEELKDAGLSIDPDTKAYLAARLGADQALSRSEVAKLALYAASRGRVTEEDIDAIVGDAAEIALENFVYDVSGGDAKSALRELGRLGAAGTGAASALAALGRHFTQLHKIAAVHAQGGNVQQAMRSLRPPPNFKRADAFTAQARRWGAGRLLQVLPAIQETVRRTRLSPDLEDAFAERLVLELTAKI